MTKINIILGLLILLIIQACDPCSGTNPEENSSKFIYFSSKPVNSEFSNIYRVSSDGTGIKEIIKNGVIYSAPSKDNRICFLRTNPDNSKTIFTCNTLGQDLKQISVDGFWNTLDIPVISTDGKYVAAYTGNNNLYLATSNGSFWRSVSSNFYRLSIPSFSPDGKYLAFYESLSLSEPWKIKIVRTDKPKEIVFEKSYKVGINEWFGDMTISWSNDSKKVFYSAVNDELNDLIVTKDLVSGIEEEFEIRFIGSAMPSFYLEDNIFAFSGKDGNLWARDYQNTIIQYYKFTNSDSLEITLYPIFSKDGKKIIYSRYFRDDYGLLKSNLMLFDRNSKNNIYLCDNTYRGFWGN